MLLWSIIYIIILSLHCVQSAVVYIAVNDDVITMTTVASLHIGCDNINCNITPPDD